MIGKRKNKMDLFVASDIHTEFFRDHGNNFLKSLPEADVGVFAGDICTKLTLITTMNILCEKYKDVVYVTGNHEYYHSSFQNVHDNIMYLQDRYENFHWLEQEALYINKQRFVGCTLWYLNNPVGVWSDGDWIKDSDQINFVAQDSRKFLEDAVTENDVVVTHMLPSHMSVHPRYAGSQYNGFFVNDVEHVIKQHQPKLYIHGHTHNSCDYFIGKTRVVCNPYGYNGREENSDFNKNLIITI